MIHKKIDSKVIEQNIKVSLRNEKSEWEKSTLGDACYKSGGSIQTGPFGSQLHKSDYVPFGIPSIMPVNIGDNRIVIDGIARISVEDAKRLSRYLVRKGDIVYSRRGDVERRAIIRDNEDGWLCGTGCLRVRFGNGIVDPLFASYQLGTSEARGWIVRHAIGATMPNLNTEILSALPFVIPPIEVQKRIADILSSLDDKIEVNRKINQTLEAMAQAMFKSWFVDFEPVMAKIEAKAAGHDPELAAMSAISGKTAAELATTPKSQYDELAHTASLFPDDFEDSELGEIPKGWKVINFGSMIESNIGGDWGNDTPTDSYTEKVKILRGTDLPDVFSGVDSRVPVRFVEKRKFEKRKLCDGDIVIEISGGSKDQPTGRSLYITQKIINRLDENVEPASFCRRFRPVNNEIGLILAIHLLKIYTEGKTWLYQNQSTGISNFQTNTFLEREPVVLPGTAIVNSFYHKVRPLFDLIHSSENIRLSELRDTLLPKLLSGELETTMRMNKDHQTGVL